MNTVKYFTIFLLCIAVQSAIAQSTTSTVPAISRNNAFRWQNPSTGLYSYGHNGTNLLLGNDEWGRVYRCAATFGPTAAGVATYAVITQATLSFNVSVPNAGTIVIVRDSAGVAIDTLKYTVKYSGSTLKVTSAGTMTANVSNYQDAALWGPVNSYAFAGQISSSSSTVAFSRQSTNQAQIAFLDSLTRCAKLQKVFNLGFMSEYENGLLTLDVLTTPSISVVWRNPMITFRNSFGGGTILIDGSSNTTGAQKYWIPTELHTVTAVDGQVFNGYKRVFNHWDTPGGAVYSSSINVNSVPNTDVGYTAVFDSMFSVTVQNDFGGHGNGGTILWNNENKNSPYTTWLLSGQSATIAAKSPQTNPNDGLEYGFRYWTDYTSAPVSRTVTPTDNLTYTAKFTRRISISLSTPAFFETGGSGGYYKIDGLQTNSAVVTSETPHTIEAFSPDNSRWVFTRWSDGNTDNPRSITPSASLSLSAVFKGVHISSDASAFANNSQRKIVETPDFVLHQVYTSAGHVWYETSTNQGGTWRLKNGGQPLDNGGGKCPSIDYNGNAVLIAFEEYNSSGKYDIRLVSFFSTAGDYYRQDVPFDLYTEPSDQYSTNANPAVAWGPGYYFVVAFERKSSVTNSFGTYQPGINCIFGKWLPGPSYPPVQVPPYGPPPYRMVGTDANSIYPSVYGNKNLSATLAFEVAYEQWLSSHSSSIRETLVSTVYQTSGPWGPPSEYPTSLTEKTVSPGTFPVNYRPSVVQMPNGDFRICWIRDQSAGYGDPYSVNIVYRNSSSSYSVFGLNARSVSLNLTANTTPYFVYSQYWNGVWSNMASNGSSFKQINVNGTDVNLSNGIEYKPNPYAPYLNFMFASSYVTTAAPYSFQTSGAMESYYTKASPSKVIYGRGICLDKGDLHFYYSFGNLLVDGNSIDFVDSPDSVNYDDLGNLNNVLETEPFRVSAKSRVIFSEQSGFVDSASAAELLTTKHFLDYKIQIVDSKTGEVLGTVKNTRLQGQNASRYELVPYRLNATGLGTKTVKAKITFSTDIADARLALIRSYSDQDVTENMSPQDLSIQELNVITDYSLDQNYPNPFNPTTTLSYAIPKDGMVTLKIFDVLGREVETLVNEEQKVGRYEVRFDGSRLASGVYFYQLKSGSHVSIKKMLMVK